MQLGSKLPLFMCATALLLLNNLVILSKFMKNFMKEANSFIYHSSSNQSLSNTTEILAEIQSSNSLAIVTALSLNHRLEGVAMLRSLIAVQFEGPVFIFLMSVDTGENDISWIDEFKEELHKSPLRLRFITMEVQSIDLNAGTYCFKPAAMGAFLRRNDLLPLDEKAKVVMWSDASSRFLQNPSIWAEHMMKHDIDFVGRQTLWTIPQQTHMGTFDYFGMTPHDFDDHPSIASGHFLINLKREKMRRILDRWVDCGVLDCHTCMAPIGSSKKDPNGVEYQEGANDYVSHRQDQSVLTLLVTDYMKKHNSVANVKIIQREDGKGEAPYFCLRTRRHKGGIQSLRDWNTTFTIPPHVCKTLEGKILNISRNGNITWVEDKLK